MCFYQLNKKKINKWNRKAYQEFRFKSFNVIHAWRLLKQSSKLYDYIDKYILWNIKYQKFYNNIISLNP